MSTQINISLMGTVAVYDDGANWNLVFITDKDHQLIISDPDGNHRDQTIRTGKDRALKLAVGQGSDPARSYTGNAKKYGLNMSEPYLHGIDPVTGKSNLNRTHSPGHGRELIRITVPYGTIDCPAYPGPDYAADYWITNTSNGQSHQVGHPIAKTLILSFKDDSGKQLELTADDQTSPAIDPWSYSADVLNLIFNNDCQGQGNVDDFIHYYDCVFHKNDKRIMFTAGKVGGGFFARQGDCDPVMVEPPPGP
jgi:hypothetical protein